MAKRSLETTASTPVRRHQRRGSGRRLACLCHVYTEGKDPIDVTWYVLGAETEDLGREGSILLDDPESSRRHASIERVGETGSYRIRDLGSRNHTFVDGREISVETLHHGSVIRIGSSVLVYAEAELGPGFEDLRPSGPVALARMTTEALVDVAAKGKLPILINGPTGAGKELLARRVHDRSGRSGAFVPVNCATFAKDLLGSELFGHVAGAFSGAHAPRSGLFAAADHGTLFLDEVGELPLEQQPALLRALQEGKVRPVGADREVAVDVRVVSATLRDLGAQVAASAFRADLQARLTGLVVDLPGLVERKEEILSLFVGFLGPKALPITADAGEALVLYEWPLNVRELLHAAERIKLFESRLDAIDVGALPPAIKKLARSGDEPNDEGLSKERLIALLEEHQGNVAQVARALGKHRQQVYRFIERHEIDAARFRPSGEE